MSMNANNLKSQTTMDMEVEALPSEEEVEVVSEVDVGIATKKDIQCIKAELKLEMNNNMWRSILEAIMYMKIE